MVSPPDPNGSTLARQARELYVVHVGRSLPDVVNACNTRLNTILNQTGSARDIQSRRDAWTDFQKFHAVWLNDCRNALKKKMQARAGETGPGSVSGQLELVAEDAIDDQILAARLAMRVLDKTSSELNELRLRIQHLERRTELPKSDILLPDVVTRLLVDQWVSSGMDREGLSHVQDALALVLGDKLMEAYKAANQFLIAAGVMKTIDMQALVKRTPGSRTTDIGCSTVPNRSASRLGPGAAFTGWPKKVTSGPSENFWSFIRATDSPRCIPASSSRAPSPPLGANSRTPYRARAAMIWAST
mgnify:CR=1 FL=1